MENEAALSDWLVERDREYWQSLQGRIEEAVLVAQQQHLEEEQALIRRLSEKEAAAGAGEEEEERRTLFSASAGAAAGRQASAFPLSDQDRDMRELQKDVFAAAVQHAEELEELGEELEVGRAQAAQLLQKEEVWHRVEALAKEVQVDVSQVKPAQVLEAIDFASRNGALGEAAKKKRVAKPKASPAKKKASAAAAAPMQAAAAAAPALPPPASPNAAGAAADVPARQQSQPTASFSPGNQPPALAAARQALVLHRAGALPVPVQTPPEQQQVKQKRGVEMKKREGVPILLRVLSDGVALQRKKEEEQAKGAAPAHPGPSDAAAAPAAASPPAPPAAPPAAPPSLLRNLSQEGKYEWKPPVEEAQARKEKVTVTIPAVPAPAVPAPAVLDADQGKAVAAKAPGKKGKAAAAAAAEAAALALPLDVAAAAAPSPVVFEYSISRAFLLENLRDLNISRFRKPVFEQFGCDRYTLITSLEEIGSPQVDHVVEVQVATAAVLGCERGRLFSQHSWLSSSLKPVINGLQNLNVTEGSINASKGGIIKAFLEGVEREKWPLRAYFVNAAGRELAAYRCAGQICKLLGELAPDVISDISSCSRSPGTLEQLQRKGLSGEFIASGLPVFQDVSDSLHRIVQIMDLDGNERVLRSGKRTVKAVEVAAAAGGAGGAAGKPSRK